jgi:hypothetical protein
MTDWLGGAGEITEKLWICQWNISPLTSFHPLATNL